MAACGQPVEPEVEVEAEVPVVDTADTALWLDSGVTDTGPDVLGMEVQVGDGVLDCADPSARVQQPFDVMHAPEMPMGVGTDHNLIGGGLAIGDFNGDEVLDVFVPSDIAYQLWMAQAPGAYANEGDVRISGIDLSGASAASTVDYDGDGDLDLFVARLEHDNVLLANDGTGVFADVTEDAGLADSSFRSLASTWGDMDGDGDLDLFVSNYGVKPERAYIPKNEVFVAGDPSYLYVNNGDGTFQNQSDLLASEIHDAHVFMAAWQDLDGDMDPELITIHDFGWNRVPQLLWNEDGVLVADDGTAQMGIPFAGMGMGIGDINGDDIPDFIQSSWEDTALLLSVGLTWWDNTALWNADPNTEDPAFQIFGWGSELIDIDVDGDLDAILLYGHWDEWNEERYMLQHDALLIQEEGAFVDRALEWGIDDPGMSRGLVTADLNDDGHPDVVKSLLDGPTELYLSRCSANAWLRVRTRAPAPNTHAIGARIRVIDGDESWVRWVSAGNTGMFSGGPAEVLFGLGERDHVDKVEIAWPDGAVTFIKDVDTRQLLQMTRVP